MKTRFMILVCFIGAVILFTGYEYGRAEPVAKIAVSKIGVVSIRKVFQECKRNAKYRKEAEAEQNRIIAELDALKAQIEADKKAVQARKAGSDDYQTLFKELLTKQASYQAQQEFYKQQLELKDRKWTEELYGDILQKTGEVAKQRELDLVFGKDEPEFPSPSTNELMLTIRTHKLLYSAGCLDITDEVMTRLDAKK